MIDLKKTNRFGCSIDQYINFDIPHHVDDDGIYLCDIAYTGNFRFGLNGDDLDEFIRLGLKKVFSYEVYVLNVRNDPDQERSLILHRHVYGDGGVEDMIEGLIADWKALGSPLDQGLGSSLDTGYDLFYIVLHRQIEDWKTRSKLKLTWV
jgi:hypothetical protein